MAAMLTSENVVTTSTIETNVDINTPPVGNETNREPNVISASIETLDMRPRKLTDDEIRDIVEVTPRVQGADIENSEAIRRDIMRGMMEQLRGTKITPLAIPDLKGEIVRQFEKSKIAPGAMVGVTAAEAFGAQITQMTLNSVDWTDVIYMKNDKNVIVEPIGKIIDDIISKTKPEDIQHYENETVYIDVNHMNYEVLSVDEDGKSHWKRLEAVTRHLPGGKLVHVKTLSGKQVKATKAKSFLTRKNNKIVETLGSEIKVGDKLPIFIKTRVENPLYELDTTRLFPKDEYVYTNELYKAKQYQNTGEAHWWKNHANKDFILPFKRPDTAMESLRINADKFKPNCIYPHKSHSVKAHFPEVLKLDRNCGFFFGAYLAEGCVTNTDTQVIISNNDSEYRQEVYKFCDSYNFKYHVVESTNDRFSGSKTTDIRIHSTMLVHMMKTYCNTGCEHKRVAPWMLISNQEFLKGLLDGYFSGDGTINKRDGYIVASSASEDLITGIMELLTRFGIFSKKSSHEVKNNNVNSQNILPVHTLSVRNGYAKIFASEIGSVIKEKQNRLNNILMMNFKYTWGKYDLIPGINIDGLQEECNRQDIQRMYAQCSNISIRNQLEQILKSDVYYDEIVSIEEVDSTNGWVYDLTVADTRNFTLLGGLCVRDTFHTSGALRSLSVGTDRFKELINLSPSDSQKSPSCFVYFKGMPTFEDLILQKRGDLVGIKVSDIVADSEVDTPDSIMAEEPWWYGIFRNTVRNDFGTPRYILRLYLNVNTMYSYKIQMSDVADAIERDTPPSVIAVYSPLMDVERGYAIMDLYPVERVLMSTLEGMEQVTQDNMSLVFLSTIVQPNLDRVQIKGVSGIRSLVPVSSPVLQIVLEQIQWNPESNIEDERRVWFLQLNPTRMKVTGITREHLVRLIEAVRLPIIPLDTETSQDFVAVQIPSEYFNMDNGEQKKDTALDYINRIIAQDDRDEQQYEQDERSKGVLYPRRPPTEVSIASKYVYGITEGTNFKALLSRDDIDTTHTLTNNVHEILDALGIEASRSFLIREFITVISMDGSYTDPRHINLLVDFMTNQGRLVAITYTGIQRQPIGALAKASFERAMDVFKEAAAFGRKEPIKSTSTSIYVGQRAQVGTGYVNVEIDQNRLQQYQQDMAKQPAPTKVDVGTFRDAIWQMDDITFGTSALTLEGAEMGQMFGDTGELVPSLNPEVTITNSVPGANIDKPVYYKARPVVSQQLQNVADTVTRSPCLPQQGTVISMESIPPTVSSVPLPGSQQTSPRISAVPTAVELPAFDTGVGLPTELLSQMQAVQNIQLPTLSVPKGSARPPSAKTPPRLAPKGSVKTASRVSPKISLPSVVPLPK